jgi:hypothetical protein
MHAPCCTSGARALVASTRSDPLTPALPRVELRALLRARPVPILLLGAAASWLLLRGIDHRFISFSDGVYLYAASIGAADGAHALYHSVTLSLPPALPLGAALLWRASPHVETIRLALAGLGLVTAGLTYRAGRDLFGLGAPAAALGALIAATGPVHAQFVGLEGEAILAPLALALALALAHRRDDATVVLLGLGFFIKLTWAPFFLAGAAAIALRSGWRKGLVMALSGALIAVAAYAAVIEAFGWSVRELVLELLLAQSSSGFQLGLLAGVVAVVAVLWWPFLPLLAPGLRGLDRSTSFVIAAAAASGLFMLKQGTFFNVLYPLEPFVALAVVAGAGALWTSTRPRHRFLVAVCALGVAAHALSLATRSTAHVLPLPLGAAVVDTDNERVVDRIAGAIDARSKAGEPVLVNPYFALIANRRLPGGAADWFILRSLDRYCRAHGGRDDRCTQWSRIKAAARAQHFPLVGVDSNVVSFDGSFRRDAGVNGMKRVLHVRQPPIAMDLFSRP